MTQFNIDYDKFLELKPEEQEALLPHLNRLNQIVEENPLWQYTPHAKQKIFHQAQQPLKGLVGGNRSGKSKGSVMDDLIQAVDRDVLPPWLVRYKKWEPPFEWRIITPKLGQGERVALQIIRKSVPHGQLLGKKWSKAYDKVRRQLWFENGSRLDLLSADQDLDAHAGDALHRVHFDEEPPGEHGRNVYTENLYRLIDYDGDCTFSMTPLLGLSWTYDELTENGQPRQDEDCFVVVVDMDDNPHLNEKAKKRTLARAKTEEERAARKSGRWVHFAGLIYPEFEQDIHVIPQKPLDETREWLSEIEVYEGIDPGIRHMAGVVFCALDHDDNMVVFEELPLQGKVVSQVAEQIKAVRQTYEFDARWTVIDPAARNKQHQTGRSDQMEYADHGIVTIPGQNSRGAGFNSIKERLQAKPSPKLYITANCETLIEQFRTYRWKTPKNKSEDAPKDEPVKVNDHLLDALRYVCMSRPIKPAVAEEPEPEDIRIFRRRVREDQEIPDHPLGGVFA
jgi:phage terminase large subunit